MGLLDDLVSKASAALGGADGTPHPMLTHVSDLIRNNPFGGLGGLVQAFHDKGLGPVVSSWISTGTNLPITGQQISQVLGGAKLQELAAKAGIPADKVQEGLATLLPQVIDKLTPHGQLPAVH